MNKRARKGLALIFWGYFLLLTFIITLPVSWWILASQNFAYSSLHDAIGINEHIARYAPRNRFQKKDFELTSRAERAELFQGVVEAIQHHGEGLDRLFYIDAQKRLIPLFTEAEVTHLQDVANLLDKLKPLVLAAFVLWLITVIYISWKKIKMPSLKQWLAITNVLVLLAAVLLLLGPEKIFNQLHIWVFPKNHQWFFYYEDSLMSTMMKAPDLFAYIAVMWSLLSVVLTVILMGILNQFLLKKALNKPQKL